MPGTKDNGLVVGMTNAGLSEGLGLAGHVPPERFRLISIAPNQGSILALGKPICPDLVEPDCQSCCVCSSGPCLSIHVGFGLSSCPANIMPRGTTIIIARGATTGRMAQLGMDMAFNQTCYVLLSGNTLDRNYLYYSMLFSVNQFRHSRMVLYLARLQLALLMNGRSPCLPSPNSASSPQLLAM